MLRRFLVLAGMVFLVWLAGLVLYTVTVTRMEPYTGRAEGIVALTGGEGRIETALDLLEQERAERLLISGVNRHVTVDALLRLNRTTRDIATLRKRVEAGFYAQDTLGNADETAAWVQKYRIESLIVVTAHYHMPRALVHLGAQLPDVALYPYPVVPKLFLRKNWFLDRNALRLIVQDYNKFLATYPQILFLKPD